MMARGPGFPPDTDLDRDGENCPSFVIRFLLFLTFPHLPVHNPPDKS
jgi:hypothetical protein